ncbi:A disintegrin and metalloproteinase with thrombospondin motifs 7-like [Belonocnema kinseyi]|uniref:A disintegrin and metalloproteinase with thrombospondin motifs 7-like n=1 Tax=Belonocnema kinseyi TaxID=2817044 RepID=UPI00143DF3AD|nr:A disintegrin and metalloproteinase with thrombospondin motifs 7-like [Belonocnema kinseyi]
MKNRTISVFLILCGIVANRLFVYGGVVDKYKKKPGSIYHGRYTRDVPDPHLLVPRRVFHDGMFHTYSLPEYYDRRKVRAKGKRSVDDANEDKLHLILPFNGIDHHVELTPYHDFISPEMVIEIRGEGISTDLNKGLAFKRVSDQQCQYRGAVRGHKNSRAALSLCDGIAGYVHTNRGRYFVEPLHEVEPESDGQHVHIAYRRDAPHEKEDSSKTYCGTDGLIVYYHQILASLTSLQSLKSAHLSLKSLQPLKLIFRNLRLENMTNFKDLTNDELAVESQKVIDQEVAAILKDERESLRKPQPPGKESEESEGRSATFVRQNYPGYCERAKVEYYYTMSGLYNCLQGPNRACYLILNKVERHDICAEDSGCSLMGLAYVSAICDRPKAACINEDSGLLLGIIVAHEVGHTLGCAHDTEEISGCASQDKDESFFLMSPYVFIYSLRWSSCSRKFITTLMETGLGDCLTDEPKNPLDKFKYPNMLPGVMYGADFQCKLLYNETEPCDQMGDCEALWCQGNGQCMTNGAPPAEGTKCAEKKWCIHKECVEIGSRPLAVNGGWGEWGKTSECSRTCGGGVKSTERECDQPAPSNGGRYCVGERKKYAICNTTPCDPTKPSFRSVQCEEFNTKEVLTDGLHKWTPYTKEGLDMCKLYCLNEKNVFMELARTVKDGTPCKAGTKNICVSGVCRKVGCDWGLDSDAVEDKCGVCKGGGAGCTPVLGEFTTTGLKSYQKVVTVPKGSRNIHMFEKKPSQNVMAVKLGKEEKYCLNGGFFEQRNGDYPCAGSMVVYTHPETDKEDILIKGPTSEDIELQYVFVANYNPGVHYEYFTKNSSSFTYSPKYSWDFVDWSECSAKCGGGTMLSEPTCIEQQSGKVTNSFCSGVPRPETKSRICNEHPCSAKWRVSQWSKCSACDGKKGFRHRKVQCVKPGAHSGEDDVQSNLNACRGRSPKQKIECVGDRPCKKICKKVRETQKSPATSRSLSLEEERQLMDNFVDVGLERYLESRSVSGNVNSGKRSAAKNFRQLLHDWVESHKAKKKRTCDLKNYNNHVKFTTTKRGSIIKDTAPIDQEILIVAPYRDDLLRSNMSDQAFQEAGDSVGVSLDTKNKKIYRGKDAINMEKMILHHNVSEDLVSSCGATKKSGRRR